MPQDDSLSIGRALEALRAGRMVIVVDDEDRENEGDIVLAADHATPASLAFMIRYTGGVVCLAIASAIADRLDLPPIPPQNVVRATQPRFTVSIEAREGVTTGISAADRATTILAAMRPDASPDDLTRPGHVFPLRALPGGVLVRAGHTEASVDLCRLAGLSEGAVISELMHDDGTMMRMPAIRTFASDHGLPIVTIADLIAYRRRTESFVTRQATTELETRYGTFTISVYCDIAGREHVALRMGSLSPDVPTLVRVHSECLTGDVLGSLHCDCGQQLDIALQMIAAAGSGIVVYLRQEGRGIGLTNKIRAYALQHAGMDTVDANRALGLPDDMREYGIGAQILRAEGVGKMRLLTNNPRKVVGLNGFDLSIIEQLPIVAPVTSSKQRRYLKAKKERMGHTIGPV